MTTQQRWDTIYQDPNRTVGTAAEVLHDNAHLLPRAGRALDLACGLGANALLLAAQGLETHAWDISPVAITRLMQEARTRGLTIAGQPRDVATAPPPPANFDVIVSCHFLERPLVPHLIAGLRPGGLLYYQTFTLARVDDTGPSNPEWRLDDNELLRMFAPLRVLVYREEGLVGDLSRGFRNRAMLVAQRQLA